MSVNYANQVELAFDFKLQGVQLLAQTSDPTFLAFYMSFLCVCVWGVAQWTSLCRTAVLIKSSHIDNSGGYPLTHTCIGQTNVAKQLEPRQSKHSWQRGDAEKEGRIELIWKHFPILQGHTDHICRVTYSICK